MATTPRPQPAMGASRVGTIDPMGPTRVYTDETLRVVAAGSAEAAFSWKRGDLDRLKARREELGLNKNDEALRAQMDSRKVELAKAERRLAHTQDEVDTLREAAKVFAEALREHTSKPAAEAEEEPAPKAGAKK